MVYLESAQGRRHVEMSVLVHLVKFKIHILTKLTTELSAKNILKNLGSLIVFGGFGVGSYFFAHSLTMYLLETAHLGLFLLHRFISMVLFVLFLSVNVGNLIVSYATFYRSTETEYFLTKPIGHVSVFVIKFLDNFFYSSTVLFLISFAVLYGYGTYFHMPWTFYVQTMVFQFFPFMVIAACLALMMLMLAMRFAERVGPGKLIALLVCWYLGSLVLFFGVTNPMQLVSSVMRHYPRVDEYFSYLDPAIVKYLPNHWIAESLYWTVKGVPSIALPYTWLLLATATAMVVLMIAFARKLFYRSWLSSLALRVTSETRPSPFRRWSLTRPSRLDSQTSVLVRKEFWQFVREPSQWIHFGAVSVLTVTFLVSIMRVDLRGTLPLFQTVSYLVVMVFNAFLIASIALRFVYPMISVEGESFWAVLSAPVLREKILAVKFVMTALPLALGGILLALFSHYPLREHTMLIISAGILMLSVTVALVSLNLAAGAFFANYKERNPIKVASSQSATITFLLCIVYLIFVVSMMFLPLTSYFSHTLRGTPLQPAEFWIPVSAVAVLSMIVASFSLMISRRALHRDY